MQADTKRQYHLFDLDRFDRLSFLNRTVDSIWKRYGDNVAFSACFLHNNVGHMGGGLDRERRTGVTVGIALEREKIIPR